MISRNKPNIKNIILIFAPLIAAAFAVYLANFVDLLVLFFIDMTSDKAVSKSESALSLMSSSANDPLNLACLTMAQYILYIIIFGIWYYMIYLSPRLTRMNANTSLTPFRAAGLIVCGYAGQMLTDSVLTLARNAFPDAFTSYDQMLERVMGAYSTTPMYLAVFLFAPIGEELLFRGVVLHYSKKEFVPVLACILNGLLFGVYHGNLIQGIYAFFFGAVLSLVAIRFNSVLPAIILHMSVNISMLGALDIYFETMLSTIMTLIVSLIIFSVVLFFVLKKEGAKKSAEQ